MKLIENQLKYNFEIEQAFLQLKMLTNCKDSYLDELKEEVKYPQTFLGQSEKLHNELMKLKGTIFERFCEFLRITKFTKWLENFLKKGS